MPAHIVTNGPVDHDGIRYENGDSVPRLSVEEAAALVAAGVIDPSATAAKPGKDPEKAD